MSLDVPIRSRVRVLVVDDSAFMRTALSRMIASESEFDVVATASSGPEALERIAALDPDVVTLDVEMPGLNGLETLRRIMSEAPRPVIMVSSVTEKDAETTFNALGAGAFDYIPKQLSSASLDILHIQSDLIAKIRAAAHSRRSPSSAPLSKKPPQSTWPEDLQPSSASIVAIGTSTGGPRALQEILPVLPHDLAVPILVVQHMPLGFTSPFAQRLNTLCSVPVHEAVDHEAIQKGVVYIAPAGRHMTVDRPSDSRALISLDTHPENSLHMPSVDILMKSVADAFGPSAMGVIMTGMGADGAEGMRAIHRRGGFTIGQDESTCTVYGMPRACAELGVLNRIVPLSKIPDQILKATRYRKRA
ncbi:MAG TPA: chemotaxis response regulator protein-glutamate methylesterase [Terriglobales bacterium]|nr:chemotaxis response regulator protein-glutamate methylesterase [Terriglobales bacterium]